MSQSPETREPDLIELTEVGLQCTQGSFTIDPWKEVDVALITHAHADHARPVAKIYYAAKSCVPFLKYRLGEDFDIRGVEFGQQLKFGPTTVSFHPAGHILGSAQIRVEKNNKVWVFTGDFKRDADPSAEQFELVPCDTFITEATFALPVYRWQPGNAIAKDVFDWWQEMQNSGRPSVLFAYSLGKAQRILSELTAFTEQPVYLHGAIAGLTELYRDQGINMLPTVRIDLEDKTVDYRGQLIIAPPGASGSTWLRRFKNASTGFLSGWMRVRGNRRRRGYDRGFVMSDHADWPGLLNTIKETGASRVLTTHGDGTALIRLLNEQGIEASELETQFDDVGIATHTPEVGENAK